jgi:hypothetical protein
MTNIVPIIIINVKYMFDLIPLLPELYYALYAI